MTIDDITIPIESVRDSHESYPYNRNMAQALYRSTILESWGSGIHRIIEKYYSICYRNSYEFYSNGGRGRRNRGGQMQRRMSSWAITTRVNIVRG